MAKNKKLGQEPAFARPRAIANGKFNIGSAGISKRLYIATKAMQGIISSGNLRDMNLEFLKAVTERAYFVADELLKQENI